MDGNFYQSLFTLLFIVVIPVILYKHDMDKKKWQENVAWKEEQRRILRSIEYKFEIQCQQKQDEFLSNYLNVAYQCSKSNGNIREYLNRRLIGIIHEYQNDIDTLKSKYINNLDEQLNEARVKKSCYFPEYLLQEYQNQLSHIAYDFTKIGYRFSDIVKNVQESPFNR